MYSNLSPLGHHTRIYHVPSLWWRLTDKDTPKTKLTRYHFILPREKKQPKLWHLTLVVLCYWAFGLAVTYTKILAQCCIEGMPIKYFLHVQSLVLPYYVIFILKWCPPNITFPVRRNKDTPTCLLCVHVWWKGYANTWLVVGTLSPGLFTHREHQYTHSLPLWVHEYYTCICTCTVCAVFSLSLPFSLSHVISGRHSGLLG